MFLVTFRYLTMSSSNTIFWHCNCFKYLYVNRICAYQKNIIISSDHQIIIIIIIILFCKNKHFVWKSASVCHSISTHLGGSPLLSLPSCMSATQEDQISVRDKTELYSNFNQFHDAIGSRVKRDSFQAKNQVNKEGRVLGKFPPTMKSFSDHQLFK